jgi:hypothetical protein
MLLKGSQGQLEDVRFILWSDETEFPVDEDLQPMKAKGNAEGFSGKIRKSIAGYARPDLVGRIKASNRRRPFNSS